jgi:Tfp pilus assembly PilM family ATPase
MTKMAGFELIALETKPMAVERAVLAAASPRGAAVIIEIGTEISRVIIWDGNIRLITTVNIGNNQLKDALGTSNFNNSNLASHDSLAPAINSFCNEIVNAIKYHQTRDHKPRPVTEIVLCGSGAEVPGMSEKIESALKIKTIRVLPRVEGNEKLKTSFITAVGLAMRPDDK